LVALGAHLHFFCFNHGAAFVMAATWANVVWKLGLVAVWAER
jgi:hypothetical protein